VACPAKFVAKQLINMRLIEPNTRVIHHAWHSHQIEIRAKQNQTMRHIRRAQVNIHR
jgi:hypothetical protein